MTAEGPRNGFSMLTIAPTATQQTPESEPLFFLGQQLISEGLEAVGGLCKRVPRVLV